MQTIVSVQRARAKLTILKRTTVANPITPATPVATIIAYVMVKLAIQTRLIVRKTWLDRISRLSISVVVLTPGRTLARRPFQRETHAPVVALVHAPVNQDSAKILLC